MYRSLADLAHNARADSAKLLQQRLVQIIGFRLRSRQTPWNVKGPAFIELRQQAEH